MRHGGPGYLQLVGKRANAVQVLLVTERLHGLRRSVIQAPKDFKYLLFDRLGLQGIFPFSSYVKEREECCVIGFQLTDS